MTADDERRNAETFAQSEAFYKNHAALYDKLVCDCNADLAIWAMLMLLTIPVCWILAFFMAMRRHHDSAMTALQIWPYFILLYVFFAVASFTKANADHRQRVSRKLLPGLAALATAQYRLGGFFPLVQMYDHCLLPPYDGHRVENGFKSRHASFEVLCQNFTLHPAFERIFDSDWRSLLHFGQFRGIAILIPLNKCLQHHTLLLRKGRITRFMRLALGERLGAFDAVNFSYSSFNKNYAAVATNQVEARYVLDPAVLERLIALKHAFRAHSVEVSFMKMEMAILLGYPRNAFELGSFLRLASLLHTESFLSQLEEIGRIVGIMELNPLAGLGGPGSWCDQLVENHIIS